MQLRARVTWLSQYISRHLPSSLDIEELETGTDLDSLLGTQMDVLGADSRMAVRQTPLADYSAIKASPAGLTWNASAGTRSELAGSAESPSSIPARPFIDAYFRNVDQVYPFMNQSKVLENLATLGDLAHRLQDSQSTLLFLVMSIGCTTLERASQVPRNTAKRFEVAYAEIIQECVCRDSSIESVQILMLLALYSLFDPAAGAPTYATVGIAARQAVTVGLTRPPADGDVALTPVEKELRYRLYWSILALDRMMAVSQGLPPALPDRSDIPLPSLTVEEFASTDRTTHARRLQTSRHVIELRQLESAILGQVHFRKATEIAGLDPIDRRATLKGLRASIEDWYSQGCLMSPMDSDRATLHSSATWLSARYYYLLILLYYPNHFNSTAGACSWPDLEQFAQRHLQATAALFQQNQLPLNCNTLYRLMPVCLVLMHGFVAACQTADWSSKSTFPFLAQDEVNTMLTVLQAFSPEWTLAHQAAGAVQQFVGIIAGGMSVFLGEDLFSLGASGERSENQGKESLLGMMTPCIARFTRLMQGVLGQSTCYRDIECFSAKETAASTGGPSGVAPHPFNLDREYQSHQPQDLVAGLPLEAVGSDDTTAYGWGVMQLDFL